MGSEVANLSVLLVHRGALSEPPSPSPSYSTSSSASAPPPSPTPSPSPPPPMASTDTNFCTREVLLATMSANAAHAARARPRDTDGDDDREQAISARWLRREAARLEREQSLNERELAAARESLREKAARLDKEARDVKQSRERSEACEAASSARLKELTEKEEANALALGFASAAEAALARERREHDIVAEDLRARVADVDARAHAVAAADEASRERSCALAQRTEGLQRAMGEIERRAAEADDRIAEAELAESRAAEAAAVFEAKKNAALAAEERSGFAEKRAAAATRDAETCSVRSRESAEASRRALAGEWRSYEAERAESTGKATAAAVEDQKTAEMARLEAEAARDAALSHEAETRKIKEALAKMDLDNDGHRDDDQALIAELQQDLEGLKVALKEEQALRSAAETAISVAEAKRRKSTTAAWLTVHENPVEEDCSLENWAKGTARSVSRLQADAHEQTSVARKRLKQLGAAGSRSIWELLPREVRASLRSAVALGDQVREAILDLQQSAVRRFLELSAAGAAEEDGALEVVLGAIRGLSSQELSRRQALVGTLRAAHYSDAESCRELAGIEELLATRESTKHLFKLRQNRFFQLRLRLPAAKARFAAAAAEWAEPEFKRLIHALAKRFNEEEDDGASPDGQVFYKGARCEVQFGDQYDGRHVPRCAAVFPDAKSLRDFFDLLSGDRRCKCVGVANGYVAREDGAQTHEVAVAVDLCGQGVLCDVRLRLRALERTQRSLGSLKFLAECASVEEVLLPAWRDLSPADGFVTGQGGLVNNVVVSEKNALSYRPTASHEWAAPPKWQTR